MKLAILFGVVLAIAISGCAGGGASTKPTTPLYVENTTAVDADGGSVSAEGVTISLPSDPSRTPGETKLRVYSTPFVVSGSNETFPKGIEFVAHPAQVGARGFTITLPINQSEESEAWFVAFGAREAWTADLVEAERVSSTHVSITVTSDQFNQHSRVVTRGAGDKGISISVATARRSKVGSTKLFKPTVSVLDPAQKLELLSSDDTLANKRTAIVIHGINNSAIDMFDLARAAMDASVNEGFAGYDQVWFVDYHDTTKGIAESAKEFASLLTQRDPADSVQIDLYGHSMGGLIARWATEKEGLGNYIHRLFTFGTPHKGVPPTVLARLLYNIPGAPGASDLADNHSFITDLNRNPSPFKDRILYCAFAGTNTTYQGLVGQWARKDYDKLGYTEDIDGIVRIGSAIPSNLREFGVCDIGNIGGSIEGKTTAILPLNHSDIGGSLSNSDIQSSLTVRVRKMMWSSPSIGGS